MWMFSAAGIIVPVIIHLWNRKQGKTLKVGSISLLTENYKQQAKNIELRERLLLLLRSLIILLLAFLLSGPAWVKQLDPGKNQGWVVIEKQNLSEAYASFKPLIDSLLEKKYEFHYFDERFSKTELPKGLAEKTDSLPGNYSYWTLLENLDQQVPSTLPVYLFTANGLKRFSGTRPELAMNLQWYTYTPKDSILEQVTKAYMTGKDSVRLVLATSRPSGTNYSFQNIPFTGVTVPRSVGNNISVANTNNDQIAVDTTTLKITVFTDKYFKDAVYVKAALDAIRKFNGRKVNISLINKSVEITAGQDWLFWLSDQPLKLSGAKNVFTYQTGKSENRASFINTTSDGAGNEYLPLNKRISEQDSTGATQSIWRDGFGEPLLTREESGSTIYRFYSRFDPAWNDLTWHDAFPRMMFNLLYNDPASANATDNRNMDEQQALPVFNSAPAATEKVKFTESYDLSQAFWLAALLLFFIERLISFRAKTKKVNA